jgi:hypothetical protein
MTRSDQRMPSASHTVLSPCRIYNPKTRRTVHESPRLPASHHPRVPPRNLSHHLPRSLGLTSSSSIDSTEAKEFCLHELGEDAEIFPLDNLFGHLAARHHGEGEEELVLRGVENLKGANPTGENKPVWHGGKGSEAGGVKEWER